MKLREGIFAFGLGIGLGLFDTVFATFLPPPFSALRLALPIVAFCIAIERPGWGIVIASVSGLLLDLFAVGGSGFAIARLAAATTGAWLLQQHVLTNRSLYATVLLALAVRIVDALWLAAASGFSLVLDLPPVPFPQWELLLRRGASDALVVSLLFFIHALVRRRFTAFRRRM